MKVYLLIECFGEWEDYREKSSKDIRSMKRRKM